VAKQQRDIQKIVKIGCCGFATAQEKYAKLFGVIEVQQTFYQPPTLATLQRWRATFPAEFEFSLKAWQLITHEARSSTYRRLKLELTQQERQECGFFRDSPIIRKAWETTYNCALALEANLILFQCPVSFKPTEQNLERMRAFFGTINRNGLQLLWEPRGNWPSQLVLQLCQELKLIYVVDPFVKTSTITFPYPAPNPHLNYYRLHGGKDYRHNFDDDELKSLLDLIYPDTMTYFMFNNVNMLENAQRFQALLLEKETSQASVPLTGS